MLRDMPMLGERERERERGAQAISWTSVAGSSGICWKHSSVMFLFFGHRRYW
jgi:hypothetical protein